MKWGMLLPALACSALLVGAFSARAQSLSFDVDSGLPPAPNILAAAPSTKGGRVVAPFPVMLGRVPALPSARKCTPKDAPGLWKLMMVYEEPKGGETTEFYARPSQYLWFQPDSSYGQYWSDRDVLLHPQMIRNAMRSQAQGLQQYLVHESGMLYFYLNSAAVKTQACFIVDQDKDFFYEGQMLLMPPNVQSPTRWVKVYTKIWFAGSPE